MERGGLRLAIQGRLDRAAGRLRLRGGDDMIGMHRPRHRPALTLAGPCPHPQPSGAAHAPHASPPPGRLTGAAPSRGHAAIPAQRLQLTAQETLSRAHAPRLRRSLATASQHPRAGGVMTATTTGACARPTHAPRATSPGDHPSVSAVTHTGRLGTRPTPILLPPPPRPGAVRRRQRRALAARSARPRRRRPIQRF